jgi:2-furoyl-CoA dehydrogenase large subunit
MGSTHQIELVVNGAPMSCQTAGRTSLADLLRDELGLTGTNLGCEHGVCGCCTVLLDGEPIRSCITLAAQADGHEITTIEGASERVQRAFCQAHALQCGYCTPGMVLATQALLDEHPVPSMPQLEDALGGNICRCTGYTQIREAVALAAAPQPDCAAPGWPAPVREDRRFVTGRGSYIAGITPPGTLHVALVTSPHAHARITAIEAKAALALDGVVAVLTGAELEANTNPLRQYLQLQNVLWFPLAATVTRYAGEWVAAVLGTSRAIAEDGAELVSIDYEPLPATLDPEAAIRDDAPLVHEAHGTNVLTWRAFSWGDAAPDADGVARLRVRWNRNSTVPLETFGVVASWDPARDLLDVWASVQMPQFPDQIARALRLPSNRVRVHFDTDVGGSYGTKRGIKHAVLAGYLSRLTGRPVKLIEDRAENMHGGDFHGPDRIFDVSLSYRADGTFTHIAIDVIDDEGAYPGRSPLQLAKPAGAITGPYRIASVAYTVTAVATNKTGQVAVRGFGQAPTNYAIEAAVDQAARQLGMGRLEIRRRNFIRADEFPYRIPSGSEYDSGDYHAVLAKAVELAAGMKQRRESLRASGMLAGIGVATCLEPSGGNAIFENLMNPANDKTTFPEGCRLRVDGDGEITAIISIASAGQGHDTLVAALAAAELGRDAGGITVVRADSLTGFPSQSPVGSRMAIVLGAAVRGAADLLKAKLVAIGAHNLGAAQARYDGGDVVAPDGQRITWAELAGIALRRQHLMPPGMEPGLEVVYVAHTPRSGRLAEADQSVLMYPCFSFEAHVVLAKIDPETGVIGLDRYCVAHDCGTVITPAIVRGMLCGGAAHGIGVALYEQFAYDDSGQPLTQSFMDYLLPSVHEVPVIELAEHCTPSPFTSFGQKGAGESGYMGAPAAIASAVNDALAFAGRGPVLSLPIKPDDVMEVLR